MTVILIDKSLINYRILITLVLRKLVLGKVGHAYRKMDC
jgi:hypothetical protein